MKNLNKIKGKMIFIIVLSMLVLMFLSYIIWAAQTTTNADYPSEEYAILGDLDVDTSSISDSPWLLTAFDANIRCETSYTTHSLYGVSFYGGLFDAISDDAPIVSTKHDVYVGSLSRVYLNDNDYGTYEGAIGTQGSCLTQEYDGGHPWYTKKIQSVNYIIGGKFSAIPDMVGPTPTATPFPNINTVMGIQGEVILCNNDNDSDLFVDIDTVIGGSFDLYLDENKPISILDLYGIKVNIEDTDDANTNESIVNAYGIYVNDITDELTASGDCYSIYSDGPVMVDDELDVTGDISTDSDIVMSNSTAIIRPDTSDESDNKRIIICGGGAAAGIRGSYVGVHGNEHSTYKGDLYLVAGDGNGTDDKGEIILYSSGERARIKSDGKVGIGTSSPDNKLHIQESDASASSNANAILTLEENANTSLQFLTGASNSQSILFGDAGDDDIGSIKYDHSTNSMALTTNASERISVTSDGFVGINATSPATRFEIEADAGIMDTSCIVTIDANAGEQAYVNFEGSSSTGISNNISTSGNGGNSGSNDVAGPKADDPNGWTHEGMIKIQINGTDYWIPFYSFNEP